MSQVGAVGESGNEAPAFEQAGAALLAAYDWKNDGFGGSPKTPEPVAAEFLMALGLRTGTPLALKAAIRSLSVLPQSELADPVEGGFFERCEGPKWREPFTRKTLEGNAALLQAFATAAAWTGDPPLRRAAAETARFIDERLSPAEGDLWAAGQGPDDDYFARMGHARAARGAPPLEGPAAPAACAAAVSAFVRAGVCLDEPRWIARARLAGRALLTEPMPEAPPAPAEVANACMDLYLGTGDKEWIARSFERVEADEWRDTRAREGETPHAMALRDLAEWRLGDRWRTPTAPLTKDFRAVAASGMSALARACAPVEILWPGGAIDSSGATPIRAALAAAWALGPLPVPLVVSSDVNDRTVRFRVRGAESPGVAGPGDAKAALRTVIALQEGL